MSLSTTNRMHNVIVKGFIVINVLIEISQRIMKPV